MSASHARLAVDKREYSLEFEWISPEHTTSQLLIFLHEGLGSVAMWRDWPRQLCDAGRFRGLVYSRPGYGRSTPRPAAEKWPVDFMHTQAHKVLPAFLQAAGLDAESQPPWLVGHSDGASIALIHAATFPERVAGVIALAPHVFVEDLSIESIQRTRETYLATTDTQWSTLRVKLARYHDDPDSAFWGWNDIWLDPAFRSWNIEAMLPAITKPVLAVQGEDDEYGTMAQVDSIARHVAHAQLLKLAHCGHSPQRDQSGQVIQAVVDFIATHT
ncbi:MAG TPA: alpha/beta hydrolase [Burkholderiaceae bacterium]|nr:alpha/beta hydrolase [Burkholderiaceae bacterium]